MSTVPDSRIVHQEPLLIPREGQAGHETISLVALLTAVLRYRRWVVGIAGIAAITVGVLTYLKPRTYTSTAAFIPQSRGATSAFASAAGLVGLLPSGGDQSQAPQFYADLLTSDELLRGVLDTVYAFQTKAGVNNRPLRDLLVGGTGRTEIRAQRAVERLKKAVSVKTALKTGVVTFAVRTRHPQLSRMLTDDLLERLNEFNMQARMARAGTERKFTEARLAAVQTELRDAETRLKEFLQYNQDFRSSSRLSVLQDQLQREVTTRQAVYTTLAQAYEQARIEEVRNTPVIMVVQHARTPVLPDARGLVLKSVLSFFVASILVAIAVLIYDYFWGNTPSAEAPAVEEFKAIVRETVADVKHPILAMRGGKDTRDLDKTPPLS